MDNKEYFEKVKTTFFRWGKKAKDNIIDYGQIGQNKISIKVLESKIEKAKRQLGDYVLERFNAGEQTVGRSEEKVVSLVKGIESYRIEISEKHSTIEKIKEEAARRTDSTTQSPGTGN